MYDKSDLIKETFITALSKQIFIYVSISYFNKKAQNEIFKIISLENFLKFYEDKDSTKDSLSFQLTGVSGKIPKLKDKKIYNLSLTRVGQKRKRQMAEEVEKVIIRAQKTLRLLVAVSKEIKDASKLKKYKNAVYKLTPLGILFPASVKNETEKIFITCRKLNNVKKALFNSKIYGLLGIIDFKKHQ